VSAGAWGAAGRSPVAEQPAPEPSGRTPLAELLHALNQPLTGLECSLEVTLAAPRTNEHYQKILHDGLALTERMRLLVEALREVAEVAEKGGAAAGEQPPQPGMNTDALQAEVRGAWCEAAEDLGRVAEMKQVRIALNLQGAAPRTLRRGAPAGRSAWVQGIFRLLDAIVALAAGGSVVRVEVESEAAPDGGGFRVQWQALTEQNRAALSRPELGLLVARARLEHRGAAWERVRSGRSERLTVRLPRAR
jgi:hypothetical protein